MTCLIEDERVKALTFTGSGAVGWKLAERAPKKRVKLELGNATPVIIAEDADIDDGGAGDGRQCILVCGPELHLRPTDLASRRPRTIDFLERFLPRVEELRLGDPADEETDVGPVIDEDARERILEWIEEARAGGARGAHRWRARRRADPADSDRRRRPRAQGELR